MRRSILIAGAVVALTASAVAPATAMSTASCEALDRNEKRLDERENERSQAVAKLKELLLQYCATTPG